MNSFIWKGCSSVRSTSTAQVKQDTSKQRLARAASKFRLTPLISQRLSQLARKMRYITGVWVTPAYFCLFCPATTKLKS